jgi:serine/threonine protein phosphatase 1
MALRERFQMRCLKGNHEELLLLAAAGERQALALLDRVGGRETLLSYGVSEAAYDAADLTVLQQLIIEHVPAAHLDFLDAFEDRVAIGDYLFVHAGVRPGVAIDRQKPADLRWIRGRFLDHDGSFGAMVVHGHTISDQPELLANRIGIDTGAYASGRLTALGLEEDRRWLLTGTC